MALKTEKQLKNLKVDFKEGKYTIHSPVSKDGKNIETIKVEGFDKNDKSLGKAHYTPKEYLQRFDIDSEEYIKRFFKK